MKNIILAFVLLASTKLSAQSNDSLCVKNIDLKYDTVEQMYKMYVTIAYTGPGNHCMCGYPVVDYITTDNGDTIAQGFSMWYFGHLKNTEQAYPVATKLTSLPTNFKCIVHFKDGNFTDYALLSYPCSTTGIEELTLTETKVFPNPFVSSTTISVETNLNNANLQLFDVLGNKVRDQVNISNSTIVVERAELPAGIYFYQVVENDKLIAKGKLFAE